MTRPPRPSTLIPLVIAATAFVAAVFGALVLGSSGDSSAGAPTQTPGDPSAASEHAVRVALPSVVQIESTGKLGSGIVFDGDGDIVTNAHVVSGARTFPVTTQDGTRHRATLRGAFPANDLAVIRTTDTELKPARSGDSSKLKAIGIAAIAGERVDSVDAVALTVAEHEPGVHVRLALQEPDGATRVVTIKLGQLPGR